MAFRNLMARLGSGSAGVETVLDSSSTTPGGTVSGTVTVTGGAVAQDIDEIRVELVATVEVEGQDGEWREEVVFGTSAIACPSTRRSSSRRRATCGSGSGSWR